MEYETRFTKKKFVDAHTHLTLSQKTVSRQAKLHLHDYYELEIILSGSGIQNLNGTIYPISTGSVYFLTPIDFHAITPSESLEVQTLAFDDTLLSPQLQKLFMNRRENFIFQADSRVTHTLQTLLSLLPDQVTQEDEYAQTCRKDLLELVLLTIARAKTEGTNSGEPETSQQVQQSMQYLFCHFREDISLEEVARQSGYTPNYFSTPFHEVTGEKFVEFLAKLRLNYAKMLLLSTDLSVTAVAEKSGFGSASNFFRRFQQAADMSPSAYRTQKRL